MRKKKQRNEISLYKRKTKMHGATQNETISANSSITGSLLPNFLAMIPSIPSDKTARRIRIKEKCILPLIIKNMESNPKIPFKIVKESA